MDALDYTGKWIRKSDRAIIMCRRLTVDKINCTFPGGTYKWTYNINGLSIAWSTDTNIKGSHNGIDIITWTTGNTWTRQGKIHDMNLEKIKIYTLF